MIRRTASALGALALVTPAVLALSSGTAHAAGVSSPSDGTVVTSPGSVSVSGSFGGCSTVATSCPSGKLTVTNPGGATAGSATKTAARGTSATSISLSVSVSGSEANGTWTVTLESGSSKYTNRFYTNIAPATPAGFTAESAGEHDVFLSWTKGAEKDLLGYTLYDGDGNVLNDSISAASVCSGSSCTYSLYYDNPTPGTYTYGYQLSATRSGGCASGSCAPVSSAKTAEKSASLTTPKPAPSPTAAPTASPGGSGGGTGGAGGSSGGGSGSDGSTGGGGGSSSSGGGTGVTSGGNPSSSPAALPSLDPVAIQKRAFALNFSNFSASLGIPKLPPLPATIPQLPDAQALPEGTYNPQLPYANATETTKTTSFFKNPVGTVTDIDPEKLWPMIAMALVLFLTAAHLRRWLGVHVED